MVKNCCFIDEELEEERMISFGLKNVVLNFKRFLFFFDGIVSIVNCEEFVMFFVYWL